MDCCKTAIKFHKRLLFWGVNQLLDYFFGVFPRTLITRKESYSLTKKKYIKILFGGKYSHLEDFLLLLRCDYKMLSHSALAFRWLCGDEPCFFPSNGDVAPPSTAMTLLLPKSLAISNWQSIPNVRSKLRTPELEDVARQKLTTVDANNSIKITYAYHANTY